MTPTDSHWLPPAHPTAPADSQGYLGIPPYGFPEPLREQVLRGKETFEGRPGAEMADYDFDANRYNGLLLGLLTLKKTQNIIIKILFNPVHRWCE